MLLLAFAWFPLAHTFAQAGRIYTAPNPADAGGMGGHVCEELTHAIAVEHDRVRVYRGALAESGHLFRFDRLPVGKYDLVLFTKAGVVYEGLALGGTPDLSETPAKNLNHRIAVADGFFNHSQVHRIGLSADGDTLLAFVERYRANNVLKQSGEALGQMVRRFEIIELARATDDWQMSASRHLYREGEPVQPQFRTAVNVPSIGGLRVISTFLDLGDIALPKQISK